MLSKSLWVGWELCRMEVGVRADSVGRTALQLYERSVPLVMARALSVMAVAL